MRSLKKVQDFLVRNYIISILIAVVVFIGFVTVFKIVTAKDEVVYAQVKVSQGLWWANTAKPSSWMLEAIRKGEIEKNVVGKSIAEIQEVRSYPWWGSEQYDIYIVVKMHVDKNKRTGKYTYNRSALAVGGPVTFEFEDITISGTLLSLSEQPLKKKYITKTITLQKSFAEDWEYNAVEVGDTYNDGVDTVFKVLDKSQSEAGGIYSNFGRKEVFSTQDPKTIEVQAQVLLEVVNGALFFREMPIKLGRTFNIQTPTYVFENYYITSIQ